MPSTLLDISLILIMGTFMSTWGISLQRAKSDLAAGGSRVCPYCSLCVYQRYCDSRCTYTECSLCIYRYHCSSTCISGVCSPKPCRVKTCRANEHCYEINPGRGECRCNDGAVCSEDSGCISKANKGDCEFYTCFENRKNCGAEGYMLSYGRQYCNKFGEHYSSFTSAGRNWIDCTRQCLTSALIKNYQADIPAGHGCDDIISLAFLTHVDCYVNCGFCDIWSTNKEALFKVYSVKDFLQWRAIAQVTSVANRCFTDSIDSVIEWARTGASGVKNIASQIDEVATQIEKAASQAQKIIDLFKWMMHPYPKCR